MLNKLLGEAYWDEFEETIVYLESKAHPINMVGYNKRPDEQKSLSFAVIIYSHLIQGQSRFLYLENIEFIKRFIRHNGFSTLRNGLIGCITKDLALESDGSDNHLEMKSFLQETSNLQEIIDFATLYLGFETSYREDLFMKQMLQNF